MEQCQRAGNAVSANQVATFEVEATAGRVMSFFSINKFDYRRSSIGASSGELQYSLNGAPFAFVGSTQLSHSIAVIRWTPSHRST
jgi:hypothetical protein